jgi:AraC-like DNA-binding protein
MTLVAQDRLSDSPYIEMVSHGYSAGEGSTIRPSEVHMHMVFTRFNGALYPYVVGPLTSSGEVSWMGGAEILWVKLKLGMFIPHMPTRNILDSEIILPSASTNSFWLKSEAWQVPNHENVETFVDWLVREEVLVYDPLVNAALQDELTGDVASRTIRHRFLRSTGLTQTQIRQFDRAQRAASALRQGVSILDTVYDMGYFDQPHLTRALKHWIGYTPAQLRPESCHNIPDKLLAPREREVLAVTES